MLFAGVHESGFGRFCCKSPKLTGDNFSAASRSDRRPLICLASIALQRSPVSLPSDDKRVYGLENFWPPVQKDFCNNIGTGRPSWKVCFHGESWRVSGPFSDVKIPVLMGSPPSPSSSAGTDIETRLAYGDRPNPQGRHHRVASNDLRISARHDRFNLPGFIEWAPEKRSKVFSQNLPITPQRLGKSIH